jgi:ankyrin repeat protein
MMLLWSTLAPQQAYSLQSEDGPGVNAKDNNGWTLLMFAAHDGQASRVKALLAAGADVNAKDGKRETALLKAVFVARGEKIYTSDKMPPDVCLNRRLMGLPGCTLRVENTRQLAAGAGSPDCVKALIAAGADLNARDRDGMTALIESAVQGNIECVKALIAAGADVKAKDRHGRTALAVAKSTEVTAILRAAGAKK